MMDNNQDFDQLSPKEFILIKGARIHNLKNMLKKPHISLDYQKI
jgi:hypothetical protein